MEQRTRADNKAKLKHEASSCFAQVWVTAASKILANEFAVSHISVLMRF